MIIKPLERVLSPMVKNRNACIRTLAQTDISLMNKIREQKIDVIHQKISPSQVDLVLPEIVESWIRSYNYGLNLDNYNYGPILEEYALEELFQTKKLLLRAADPYISQLETMLLDSECIILLSDENGVFLRVIEGHKERLKQQNARFHLVPGSVWTEETVGTCAHGITLILETPMQICGPEHYCETYDQISATSAPIFDANRNLAGTLCIVTPSFHHQSAHSLGLTVAMAWAVQNEFQLSLNRELLNATLEVTDEAVITINKKGIITKANVTARKMFDYLERDLVNMQIEDILGNQSLIQSVLEAGKPVNDVEIEIEKYSQRIHLCSAHPVKDQYGENYGCILTLRKNNRYRKIRNQANRMEPEFTFDKLVGSSPIFVKSIDKAKKFALLDANILIQGESGTGKEMFAQAIHNASRPGRPFVAVNCAAIPSTLIESELFGYEGGAFTGAERQGRIGKIELANGGTLFLDEIGDMPLELQPVLLRVLEEKKVMRVGGSQYIPIDFRLITATNKNLSKLVKNEQFRQDLYFRLAALKIHIPPLRERGADIIRLANYFIKNIADKQQILAPSLSSEAVFCLLQYNWPGNVRQLENAMLYAVNTARDGIIKPGNLPEELNEFDSLPAPGENAANLEAEAVPVNRAAENVLPLKDMERITIIQALLQTGSNISEAANMLKMSRSTLYRKIKEYNIFDEIRAKR